MAVGDIYQLTLTGDIDGQRVQNVLHFKEKVATDQPIPASDLIEAWITKFAEAWADCLSAGWHMTSYYCRRVQPAPGIPFLRLATTTAALQGTRGDAVCPPQTCLLFSLYTLHADRHGRGRIYMPGVAEADQDAGQIVEALVTPIVALEALLNDQFAGTGTGAYRLCVYSRVESAGYDVELAGGRSNLATQRPRRAYPGIIEA